MAPITHLHSPVASGRNGRKQRTTLHGVPLERNSAGHGWHTRDGSWVFTPEQGAWYATPRFRELSEGETMPFPSLGNAVAHAIEAGLVPRPAPGHIGPTVARDIPEGAVVLKDGRSLLVTERRDNHVTCLFVLLRLERGVPVERIEAQVCATSLVVAQMPD